jgi:hypothetical protein
MKDIQAKQALDFNRYGAEIEKTYYNSHPF